MTTTNSGGNRKYHITSNNGVRLSNWQKRAISEELTSFLDKYEIREPHLRIDLRAQKQQFRGQKLIYCGINLTCRIGHFHTISTGWGLDQAIAGALENIACQIEKKNSRGMLRVSSRDKNPSVIG